MLAVLGQTNCIAPGSMPGRSTLRCVNKQGQKHADLQALQCSSNMTISMQNLCRNSCCSICLHEANDAC